MILTTNGVATSKTSTNIFFGSKTKEEYRKVIFQTVEHIIHFLENEKVHSGATPQSLRDHPGLKIDEHSPKTFGYVMDQLKDVFLDHTVSYHHPDYVSHLNCPVLLSSIAGELIATSVNTAIETWDQSTSGTLIEQEVIRWICSRFNLPDTSSDGIFTSGGTQSNFMGLLMARDHAAFSRYGINLKENGWAPVVSRFRVFCSEKAHFSIKKNAALLGMGYDAVVTVAVDERMQMRPDALLRAIENEHKKGNVPIAVIATMGTTDFGSFDPLDAIAEIAHAHDLWLHTDGAYGGCYVLTETHGHLLSQIYKSDSVTVDFHKTLFQPVSSSVFLLKDKVHFQYVSHFADYLNPIENRNEEQPDLIEKSIQTTRRFDALKLWVSLKVNGSKSLGSFLEKVHKTALETHQLLENDPHFELAHKPALSTVVFRYISPATTQNEVQNSINKYIRSTLFRQGDLAIATTKHAECIWLKFTFLNPETSMDQIQKIIQQIKNTGQLYKTNN